MGEAKYSIPKTHKILELRFRAVLDVEAPKIHLALA
jgi:hypothetical protein